MTDDQFTKSQGASKKSKSNKTTERNKHKNVTPANDTGSQRKISQEGNPSNNEESEAERRDDGSKSVRSEANNSSQAEGKEANENKNERTRTATKRSPNKLYHAPRLGSPTPFELQALQRALTLDCIAVDTTSRDYGRARPKLGQVLPPYNAQKDRATSQYFHAAGVSRTLSRTGQKYPGVSIEGRSLERFYDYGGAGHQYLSRRNMHGAGHSRETIDGHAQFMMDLKSLVGYNGRFGYRRNNPWLRRASSTFGLVSDTPIH